MIQALVEKYGIRMAYVDVDGRRSECPELQVVAGVVFFLKTLYFLEGGTDGDLPRKSHPLSPPPPTMQRLGLPQAKDLVQWWRGKRARIVNYRRLPQKDRLPWDELDDYLYFCTLHGLQVGERPSPPPSPSPTSTEGEPQMTSPFSKLLFYPPAGTPPPWQDAVLADWQREELAELIKSWRGPPQGTPIERVAPDYALLLTLAGDLVGLTFPTLILKVIHGTYEAASLVPRPARRNNKRRRT